MIYTGKILQAAGGEGADLDIITAAASDVKEGKVILGPDGNPIEGTMAAVAGRTVTPGKANQTVISAGQWASGNIVVAGDADLIAANIKKGVNLFGVTGTFEGYVPSDNDLYLRGNNIAGWTTSDDNKISFESGGILVKSNSDVGIRTPKSYNLTPYTKLNVQHKWNISELSDGSCYLTLKLSLGTTSTVFSLFSEVDVKGYSDKVWREVTTSFDITNCNYTRYLFVSFDVVGSSASQGWVYRIWLS